ncbi:hypothetical protein CHGG_01470 [Chaetomium globosum CBS 148.51]|uniref:Uncharacterized protein n=1 Tax=Chaetomium globosum (strain ATCC 6205 / CBS 148.51 / DSM 1962 / NBRC 6347 / NRRL 1970) TaxID=306901 RepID=Q2HE84_CHAGB|nr:uncharacterized protein CHGG_01470 [Chaetomium globosum CBS 148.51]EAQ93235.1 hypothetical protein CHGG_01470 [Chaetomium globosum CBS 148.51]
MDPAIRSRYCRRYTSSTDFEATNRICRGLVRRIERCSEGFITRKDSGALEMFKNDTYERKPQRFEMTFRVMRRGMGEWAERTYRSYEKQPLTIAHTKEVMLSVHWMIGLFMRRHDRNFRWLDCPAPELDSEGSETAVPSRDGPLSTLSIPRSRFVETSQAFEFVSGYSIEIYFRSRNPHRRVPTFEKRARVSSTQTTPLTLFLSEDMLWKALQFANQALDSKKRQFDHHLRDHRELYSTHLGDDTFELSLRVQNHLGPAYNHVQRSIKSTLALFRDLDAQDCGAFFSGIEEYLSHIRDEADALLSGMNDFEIRIAELKGVGWTVREAAKFTLGPSASYGRRTIQAALDRIQTGIGDVIRGHNIAIHVNAHKRGHLVLDKAIVAHEKHGSAKETFASREDAQAAFVERLKAQVQKDMDKIFEDSCAIDDIPEYEDDYFATRPITPVTPLHPEHAVFDMTWAPVAARPITPVTPLQPEQAVFDEPSPRPSPSSVKSSPAKRPALGVLQSSPKPRARRLFSLSRRSTESVRSIDYLKKAARDLFSHDSKSGSVISEEISEPHGTESPVPVPEARGPLLAAAEVKSTRSFSLFRRSRSSTFRTSNTSTLVEEQIAEGGPHGQNDKKARSGHLQGRSEGSMTSGEEASSRVAVTGTVPVETPSTSGLGISLTVQQPEAPCTENKNAPAALRQKKQGRMDSPEFTDAREYLLSPASEEVAQSELSGALARVVSPREDDDFSTAPSTPELSTGASSPRHSVLITPESQRTKPDTKDTVLQDPPSEKTQPSPPCPLGTEPHAPPADSPPALTAPASDSPTPESEIRPSDPSEQPSAALAPDLPAAASAAVIAKPADRLDASSPGSELGAGHGAEVGTGAGTGGEGAEGGMGPTSVVGSDVGVGEAGVGDGFGFVHEEFGGERLAAGEVTARDVGPGGEVEGGGGSVGVDTRDAGVGDEEGSRGPGSHAEVHIEPQGGAVIGEDVELGAVPDGPDGPDVFANQVGNGHAAGDSDSETPLEEGKQAAVPDPGSDTLPNGDGTKEEPGAVSAVSDATDATEGPKQGFAGELEESVSVPVLGGLPGDNVDGGARGKSEVDAVCTEAPGFGTLEEDEGDSIMDPIVLGAAETDSPKFEDVEGLDTVPMVASDGQNADEQAAEQSVAAPAALEAVKHEARNNAVAQFVGHGILQVDSWADGIGGEDAYESEEPRSDPRVGNDDLLRKAFGPEARIDETGASSEVGDRRVCADSGTSAPDSHGKHIAPEISADSPVNPSTLRESLEFARTPASTQPAKPNPNLAPIPDLSKLPKSIPALSRISLSSDTASFISPVRDSVDTIRPSTDETRYTKAPPTEQAHTNKSRPQTAGYLHIGLHETRLVEVGLRGALGGAIGGARSRRMSLPLQNLLLPDGEAARDRPAAAERSVSSGPAAKPDDPRKPLRKGMKSAKELGEGGGDELDDGRSVLPRMMMLLAGAVAIGKMMKGPGD